MEERMVELELRYMELKRLVDDLSSVVAAHERTIERMNAQHAATLTRLRDLTAKAEGPVGDEKPPHY